MARYIDAEKLLKKSMTIELDGVDVEVVAIGYINGAEPADVAPVVRCSKCVYSEPLKPHADLYNKNVMNCACQHGEEIRNVWHKYSKQYHDYSLVESDDFCSFGEKPVDSEE